MALLNQGGYPDNRNRDKRFRHPRVKEEKDGSLVYDSRDVITDFPLIDKGTGEIKRVNYNTTGCIGSPASFRGSVDTLVRKGAPGRRKGYAKKKVRLPKNNVCHRGGKFSGITLEKDRENGETLYLQGLKAKLRKMLCRWIWGKLDEAGQEEYYRIEGVLKSTLKPEVWAVIAQDLGILRQRETKSFLVKMKKENEKKWR